MEKKATVAVCRSAAGAGSDDDQIPAFEAGGEDGVEVHEAGGNSPHVGGDRADARCC